MGSSVWPTIEAVLNGQLQPPEPLHLVVANGLALGLSLLLFGLAKRPPFRRRVPFGRVTIPGTTTLEKIRPSTLYIRLANVEADHMRKAWRPHRLDEPFADWDTTVVGGLDIITKQLLYFAVPLVLAEAAGFPTGLAVGIGAVFWVVPTRYHKIPIQLMLGTSFAWLWLTGGWWLALGSALVLFLSMNLERRINQWFQIRKRQRRRNRRNELTE